MISPCLAKKSYLLFQHESLKTEFTLFCEFINWCWYLSNFPVLYVIRHLQLSSLYRALVGEMVKACIHKTYSASFLAGFQGLVNEILYTFYSRKYLRRSELVCFSYIIINLHFFQLCVLFCFGWCTSLSLYLLLMFIAF